MKQIILEIEIQLAEKVALKMEIKIEEDA